MPKRIIKLTESTLHAIIKETINTILEEQGEKYEIWYRGYKSKYGSQKDNMIWLTDDISYARAYGNRVEEVKIDLNKLHLVSIYDLDDILGYEMDYYEGLDEEEAQEVLSQGYNGYEFEANHNMSDCLALFSTEPIVSRRELSREEFDNIEVWDDLENREYDDDYNE